MIVVIIACLVVTFCFSVNFKKYDKTSAFVFVRMQLFRQYQLFDDSVTDYESALVIIIDKW